MPADLAPLLMVQGASSSAGKSTLVAGLCRLLARRGLRVAPFKAQNMSNNAAVCPDGGEIGRAQFAQAEAARVRPTVDMNPVLLKPQPGAAQVVVRGQVVGSQTAADYFSRRRREYWPLIVDSLDRLRAEFDLVVVEGAGSPAEINLRERDVANMAVALHAAPRADVLLVADIDRGGAFAALLGTFEWLAPAERDLVRGFVLNKFRGDAALLAPAPERLAQRTGVPTLGVVPFVEHLDLPTEDAASLEPGATGSSAPYVEIGVVRLPHLANFDEFEPLRAESDVRLQYVTSPAELRAPDLVIVPGSKATVPDLRWLHERGLVARIQWLAARGTPVLGVCGGFQMLGRAVRDPLGVESNDAECAGVGLFASVTDLGADKTLRHVAGEGSVSSGFWRCLTGQPVRGYEIHVGSTTDTGVPGLLRLNDGQDGAVADNVAGTYVHGVFEQPEPRHALVRALAERGGFAWLPAPGRPDPYDRLADVLAMHLDLSALPTLTTRT